MILKAWYSEFTLYKQLGIAGCNTNGYNLMQFYIKMILFIIS